MVFSPYSLFQNFTSMKQLAPKKAPTGPFYAQNPDEMLTVSGAMAH
jgi:hypothetical protein